jgi:hypothetical protein
MVVALLEQLVQGLKDVGFAVVMEFGPILEDLTALEKFVKIQVGESMNDVVEEKGVVRLDYLVGKLMGVEGEETTRIRKFPVQ